MSDNAIDSESISKPAPDTAKPKERTQSGQEGEVREPGVPILKRAKTEYSRL